MDPAAMRRAVELASTVRLSGDLPAPFVADRILEAIDAGPIGALSAQAALCGALARIAESMAAVVLSDVTFLERAAVRAGQGAPFGPSAVGMDADSILRAAGLAAADL